MKQPDSAENYRLHLCYVCDMLTTEKYNLTDANIPREPCFREKLTNRGFGPEIWLIKN